MIKAASKLVGVGEYQTVIQVEVRTKILSKIKMNVSGASAGAASGSSNVVIMGNAQPPPVMMKYQMAVQVPPNAPAGTTLQVGFVVKTTVFLQFFFNMV